MSAQVLELRRMLEQRFPDAVPAPYRTTAPVGTGVEALDRVLPGGGLPRGRMIEWTPGGGATALLRAACAATVRRGERAAWVDGAGVVIGEFWWPGPVLVRPEERRQALACVEELLLSGGFALVVLAGGGDLDSEGVRLSRRAREGGAAFVALSESVPVAALRLASRITPEDYVWRRGPFGEPAEVEEVRTRLRVTGTGWDRRTEVSLAVAHHEVRLSADPGWVDRPGGRG